MKLLIAGSRTIDEFDLSKYIPKGTDLIITGGAKGIDALAEKYADENGIKKQIFHPNYERFGRVAPIKRNEEMVKLADEVLIIWDGKSKGSKYVAQYAARLSKKVTLI